MESRDEMDNGKFIMIIYYFWNGTTVAERDSDTVLSIFALCVVSELMTFLRFTSYITVSLSATKALLISIHFFFVFAFPFLYL